MLTTLITKSETEKALVIDARTSTVGDYTITIPKTTLEINGSALGDFYPVNFSIDGTSYDLESNPPIIPAILEARKKEILDEMNLEDVIKNLNLCADLLYLAFNGVAGEHKLQGDISDLQSDLEKLCSEASLTMKLFRNECDSCMSNMILVYQAIFNCEEEAAIDLMKEIGASAKKMSEKANALATSFENLADKAQKIHKETIERRNLRNDELREKEEKRRAMVAKLKGAAARFKDLAEEIKDAEEELKEAKADAKAAAQREMILGLTTVVMNGVGAVASAVVAGMTAQATLARSAVSAVVQTKTNIKDTEEEDKKPIKEAERKKDEAKEELDKKETEAKVLENTKKALEEKKAKEEDEDKKNAIETEITNTDIELTKKNAEKEQAKQKYEAKVTALTDLQKALDDKMKVLNEQLNKQQEFAQTAAEAARREVSALRTQKNKLRAEKREILGSVKEFAESIKDARTDEEILHITIESLNQAIMAMSKVVVALKAATYFWRSLAQYCEGLSKPKFTTKLNFYKRLQPEKKLSHYYNPAFLFPVIDYAIRWKALRDICDSYQKEANIARVKVLSNIEISDVKNASIDGARRLAPQLAQKLFDYTKKEEDRYTAAEKAEQKKEKALLEEINKL